MSVYKEGFYAINEIKKSQIQIFNDSCDFGVPVRKGDRIWNLAKQLSDCYGDKNTRKANSYSTGKSVDITVTVIDEWAVSDEIKTLKQATEKWHLSFVTCNTGKCKGYFGYVSINKI